MKALTFLILICNLLGGYAAYSQFDSTYYNTYERQVTARYYFSKKFTGLNFASRDNDYVLKYRPNTTLNMGVGATYKWATLNLAYGFGFLNPEKGRGDTRYLDLQFHSYGRKTTLDVFGQFYRGFYLDPRGKAAAEDEYYLRPDLRVNAIGASFQSVRNYKQFSYRASFLQNEWQKKSAGTFLIGGELFVGRVRADSSIVPTAIYSEDAAKNINLLRFIEFGPNAGYAYTYVYKKNFFFTGAASVSLDVGINSFYDKDGLERVTRVSPNTLFRISTGYNSAVWSANILFVTSGLRLSSSESYSRIALNTGNIRLNWVYRFKPNKRVRKYLEVIDNVNN